LKRGFKRREREPTLYIKSNGTNFLLILFLYVDELIYTSSSIFLVEDFNQAMMIEFEMTDLGLMHYFLGIKVRKMNDGIFISQEEYATTLLHKWKMENCDPMSTLVNANKMFFVEDGAKMVDVKSYRGLIGSLMYLSTTRPDILQEISLISRFMPSPSKIHFGEEKIILRHVHGTSNFGI
jgi:hypothetical protein